MTTSSLARPKPSQVKITSGPDGWNWWDTGAGATVAQEPKPGRIVGQRCRSQSETELPDFHTLLSALLLQICCTPKANHKNRTSQTPADLRFYSGAGWTRTSDQRIMSLIRSDPPTCSNASNRPLSSDFMPVAVLRCCSRFFVRSRPGRGLRTPPGDDVYACPRLPIVCRGVGRWRSVVNKPSRSLHAIAAAAAQARRSTRIRVWLRIACYTPKPGSSP